MPEKDKAPVEVPSEAGKDTDGVNKEAAPPSKVIEPDWKELLRLEQQRSAKLEEERSNYKEGMLTYKRQLKDRNAEPPVEEGKPTDSDAIKAAVAEALAPIAQQLAGNKTDQILAEVVSDPAKREYVKALYQSRIQKTGNSDEAIRSDLSAALALADSQRFSKENAELKRMHDNKVFVPPAPAGSGGDKGTPQKAYKWTPEQEASLEQRAMMNGITNVEKYKELAWKASQEGSAFEVKNKYL